MVSSVGKPPESLREFALDEHGRPVANAVADPEIHVMDLDVSQVMRHDLGHRSWARRHDALLVPAGVVECVPGPLEETQRMLQVRAEFRAGSTGGGVGCYVLVVPGRVHVTDLPFGRTTKYPDMGLRLVDEVCDDMRTRPSR
jgi:hypothetical protein